MLIWYGNIGEETVYFRERLDHYPVLFYGNLLLNFVAPFLILMRNDTKRKYGTLIFTSVIVFLGHWVDYFLMLKPGILHTAQETMGMHGGAEHSATEHAAEAGHHGSEFLMGFHFPGLLELGTMIGFLSLFLYFVFSQLEKAALEPKNDPYYEESLHHESTAIKPD
jgi:Ni/Fe-hydrogenase subunit HybB-like protein